MVNVNPSYLSSRGSGAIPVIVDGNNPVIVLVTDGPNAHVCICEDKIKPGGGTERVRIFLNKEASKKVLSALSRFVNAWPK